MGRRVTQHDPELTTIGRTTMLRFIRAIKFTAAVLIAVIALAGASTESGAQSGRVRLHFVKVEFIMGLGDGSGVLIYHGQRIPLRVSGIGLGSLGVAAVDLVGTAYNLQRPGLIAGTYEGAGAGTTFVRGGQVAYLQNQNGVILELQRVQAGFQVSMGLAGMTIALQ
jgi:hypothetical protein